jgi:hypothetical protein
MVYCAGDPVDHGDRCLMENRYTMGQVAKDAGVTKNTLAKWEQAGKVPMPKRERGGNKARSYSADERTKILEYAASRKELIDPPYQPHPIKSGGIDQRKTA